MTRYAVSRSLLLAAAILLPLLSPARVLAETPLLDAPQDFAVGVNPNSVAAGDFNGDGAPDLAVANFTGSSVSVLIADGSGTFRPAVTYTAGTRPHFIDAADLNGDGKVDLAVANWDSNNVSVLLGNGDGTFAAAQSYATGVQGAFVGVSDLNGDGKPDLAVTDFGSGTVSVLLGLGNGTFGVAVPYTVGTNPHWIAFGPALVVTSEQIDEMVELLDRSISETLATLE